jgi:hypothetical protein
MSKVGLMLKLFVVQWVFVVGLSLFQGNDVQAESKAEAAILLKEPSYCHPSTFDEKEFSLGTFEQMESKGLIRAHAFRLGKVTVIGAGVGNSQSSALIELAQKYAAGSKEHSKDKNYCTWYLNHPKKPTDLTRIEAAKTFIQKDIVKGPQSMTEEEATQEFMKVLENSFDQGSKSFLSCASEESYIALGCNEMMHRGPSVFGMLLAFSGCSPEHSLEITNQVWGLNGVKRKVRLAIIRKAYELGMARLESRKKLAALFSK